MTRFDDMPYEELKAEREYQTAQALLYAREYLNAVESGQEDWGSCRKFGCGCRAKREQLKEAAA